MDCEDCGRGDRTVQITYLGHAGFCVETHASLVLMDPWLSPTGAFDSAWFQFPRNHHLAAWVQEKLQNTSKATYVYISHEHKDHFDPEFLDSLQSRNFTLIVPKFERPELLKRLRAYRCNGLIACTDGQCVPIVGGYLQVFLDDAEMDRDSAILVCADGHSFLNINDCKIHDRLADIRSIAGPIDVFTAQFSGAVWHPTCYDYPRRTYEAIATRKVISKFESVARAIDTLKPAAYLTSAGPACFLDPALLHLNFERVNIFPRADRFIAYLHNRLPQASTVFSNPMPGDVYDVASKSFAFLTPVRVDETNATTVIREYAALYEGYFADRQRQYADVAPLDVYERLKGALAAKLERLALHERVKIPLYFRLSDHPAEMLRVNFPTKQIDLVDGLPAEQHYMITAPSWEVMRVLEQRLTWEDFTLTFRMRLNRDPDVYHVVIHGFLMMEAEDMNRFCAKVLSNEADETRTLFEIDGKRYSMHRFCPHQKADLTTAWVERGSLLTCPRHRWQFDLSNAGKCTTNDASICAFAIEEE